MKYPKITNKFKLPQEVYNAIVKDRYSSEDDLPCDYSATTLIAPIRQTMLIKRHQDELKVFDVVDMFWSFMGSIAHTVLEEAWHGETGTRVEERLYDEVLGTKISGKLDCYANGEIRDYKTTKVYKIQKADYTEWEKQLNIYAYLCRRNGFEVTNLRIIAILFDWKEGDTYKENYPSCPIVEIHLPLWTEAEQKAFVDDRIMRLQEAEKLSDDELPLCTDKEMWCDIKDYAVMKDGGKRAVKCFDNFEQAREYRQLMNTKNKSCDYDVVVRKTDRTRCLKYCSAATVCKQHEELLRLEKKGNDDGDEPSAGLIF